MGVIISEYGMVLSRENLIAIYYKEEQNGSCSISAKYLGDVNFHIAGVNGIATAVRMVWGLNSYENRKVLPVTELIEEENFSSHTQKCVEARKLVRSLF